MVAPRAAPTSTKNWPGSPERPRFENPARGPCAAICFSALMFPAFLVRPLRLVLALVALATAAELAAVRFAAADGERTLVVRGRVLDASGSPATNARITVRGAVRL